MDDIEVYFPTSSTLLQPLLSAHGSWPALSRSAGWLAHYSASDTNFDNTYYG